MEAVVTGAFDDLRSRDLRFLQEASRLGRLTVLLSDDESVYVMTGERPKFPFAERLYFLKAVRYVAAVIPAKAPPHLDALPEAGDLRGRVWVDQASGANAQRRRFCQRHGLEYRVLEDRDLAGFPEAEPAPTPGPRKKVVATGCYDWLHSGHVRFFEEVSAYGDLYVIVGHDANIRLLKGEGHPLLGEAERRFMAASIRYVTQALISTGKGWLDADPEIQRIKPDIYAVNEDGDRGGKRDYCKQHGIEYLVLKRVPAPGLPGRSSTDLRGF
ncbi:MAG TPA: adenylyltransferase/cytidyltransferase family protein [Verrucomicrobiae bacterium]